MVHVNVINGEDLILIVIDSIPTPNFLFFFRVVKFLSPPSDLETATKFSVHFSVARTGVPRIRVVDWNKIYRRD